MSLIFDMLKLSRTLGRAFTPEQAEVLTEALTINVNEGLATKAELAAAVVELKAEIAGVRTEIGELETELTAKIAGLETKIAGLETRLTAKIASDKTELIRWIVASFVGNVVTMITIAKFFAHP